MGELHITGLTLDDSANPKLVVKPSDKFHIVVGHRPDFALSALMQAELLVAGHTHGGQVRLPFIGPLITFSEVPRSWAAGVTQLQENKILSVSRGIGMERDLAPRLRFLCRPQIVVIDLIPAVVE
jgi:predicted MPP superfamily phosphohydrolase